MAATTQTETVDLQDAVQEPVLREQDSTEGKNPREQTHKTKTPRPKLSPRRLIVLFALLVAAVSVAAWWVYARNYESTDDAQIDGHVDLVSSRVSGTVVYINPKVENNQFVEAGTLLLEFDPRDYEAELEHAKANLDTRIAEAHSASVNVPIVDASSFGGLHSAEAAKQEALASVEAAQANLEAAQHKLQQDQAVEAHAERDRVRYLALVEKEEVSRSYYDARLTDATAATQAVQYDRAAIASAQKQVDEARQLVDQREAQLEAARVAPQQVTDARSKSDTAVGYLEQARAELLTAQLNLSYTKIYAPVSGVIGRKTVELGHRIQPGQSLLIIVPLDDIWITANFKETQLKYMRPGQPVTIRVDTFGRDYKGVVENLAGAAGPLFSLFPPENATGNYVKVVQRFPVRIRLDKDQDPEHLLRPGMSVEPTVKVR